MRSNLAFVFFLILTSPARAMNPPLKSTGPIVKIDASDEIASMEVTVYWPDKGARRAWCTIECTALDPVTDSDVEHPTARIPCTRNPEKPDEFTAMLRDLTPGTEYQVRALFPSVWKTGGSSIQISIRTIEDEPLREGKLYTPHEIQCEQ